MPIYERGWDQFTPENAKEFQHQNCRVCGTKFDVEKNVIGATSWSEGIARMTHKHDVLTCPHSGESWHDQALDILREAEKTSSFNLQSLLIHEAHSIVRNKQPTKAGYKRKSY